VGVISQQLAVEGFLAPREDVFFIRLLLRPPNLTKTGQLRLWLSYASNFLRLNVVAVIFAVQHFSAHIGKQ